MRQRFIGVANIDGKQYAVPKDWGTTGYVVNTAEVEGEMTIVEGVLGPHAGRPLRAASWCTTTSSRRSATR